MTGFYRWVERLLGWACCAAATLPQSQPAIARRQESAHSVLHSRALASLHPPSQSAMPLPPRRRDGYCRTDMQDHGRHVVCARVTQEWLEFSKARVGGRCPDLQLLLLPLLPACGAHDALQGTRMPCYVPRPRGANSTGCLRPRTLFASLCCTLLVFTIHVEALTRCSLPGPLTQQP